MWCYLSVICLCLRLSPPLILGICFLCTVVPLICCVNCWCTGRINLSRVVKLPCCVCRVGLIGMSKLCHQRRQQRNCTVTAQLKLTGLARHHPSYVIVILVEGRNSFLLSLALSVPLCYIFNQYLLRPKWLAAWLSGYDVFGLWLADFP